MKPKYKFFVGTLPGVETRVNTFVEKNPEYILVGMTAAAAEMVVLVLERQG